MFGLFRLAVIAQQINHRYYHGQTTNPAFRAFRPGVAFLEQRCLRLIRTGIEVSVLVIGWLLGGVVGLGTVAYALLIGPLVQFFLPWFIVDLHRGAATPHEDVGPEAH